MLNDEPGQPATFDVPEVNPQPVLDQIRAKIQALTAGGGTAIYDALSAAYQVARTQAAQDPNRFTSIVLLTDGENNTGTTTLDDFRRTFQQLPPADQLAPVFPILFGDSNVADMTQLAHLTDGQVFDARTTPWPTPSRKSAATSSRCGLRTSGSCARPGQSRTADRSWWCSRW